ncbi:hypothetical protein GQ53DRAFT_742977 [Thozetella sp. PMI_491]|nr:hypothetical protein GQ53DRAFT_742977 [Thozetella sp. PMI_491]
MERLQAPGALEQPEISAHLAPMIRHAIRLTSLIEESYLWVDTVCISHGSYEETSRELLRMGAIYANAVLTIIAADGDSHDGLLGLKGVSNPRELSQRIIPFGDEKIVVRNTGAFSMLGGTRYYERGWTYQELKMSPRKLLFNHKELHWECQCNLWHEELTLGSEAQPYIDSRSREILAGFPDLAALSNIILSYNELELTYDEDALSGILGMLTVFSRSFIGGFLYGLPEMMFDRCLGWQPLWGNTDLRRRVHSGRAGASTLSPSELPSWSWIGWQGQVKAGHEAARHNPREHVSEETTPITTWYTSSSLEATSSLRKIKSTWFQDRIACKDFSRPLPPGWTRHSAASAESFRQEPHLSPDGCGEFVFRHCNMEDDDKSSWYYPFPAADIRESTPPSMPEQTRYLFCETKKGRLWGRRVPTNSERDELLEQNILGLFSESGTKVGTLHLHGEEHLNSFPDNAIDDEQGRGIELVAIYKSRRYSKTWNEALQRYDHPIEVKDFYKVLWVEWEGRVAYRLASGMVELAAWESLDLENISLVLG